MYIYICIYISEHRIEQKTAVRICDGKYFIYGIIGENNNKN